MALVLISAIYGCIWTQSFRFTVAAACKILVDEENVSCRQSGKTIIRRPCKHGGMAMSGVTPKCVKGKSSCRYKIPNLKGEKFSSSYCKTKANKVFHDNLTRDMAVINK